MRQGAVMCGLRASQNEATALVRAASGGHVDTVELLLDRGADLEAKDKVITAAVCCCATGCAGRHRRACVGDGADSSRRRAPVVGRRGRRRWRGADVGLGAMALEMR